MTQIPSTFWYSKQDIHNDTAHILFAWLELSSPTEKTTTVTNLWELGKSPKTKEKKPPRDHSSKWMFSRAENEVTMNLFFQSRVYFLFFGNICIDDFWYFQCLRKISTRKKAQFIHLDKLTTHQSCMCINIFTKCWDTRIFGRNSCVLLSSLGPSSLSRSRELKSRVCLLFRWRNHYKLSSHSDAESTYDI